MQDRQQPPMPQVEAIWDGVTFGTLCEGDDCTAALLTFRDAMFADGSWVRAAHDPDDPMRQFIEEGEDGAEAMIARYRDYVNHLPIHRR